MRSPCNTSYRMGAASPDRITAFEARFEKHNLVSDAASQEVYPDRGVDEHAQEGAAFFGS